MISMLTAQIYHLALYPVTAMLGLLVMDILAQVSNKDNFIHSCPGFSFDVFPPLSSTSALSISCLSSIFSPCAPGVKQECM